MMRFEIRDARDRDLDELKGAAKSNVLIRADKKWRLTCLDS